MASLPPSAVSQRAEIRCPACIRFKPPKGPCPTCGCGEVPPERHGAARVLLHDGVDRSELAQRVAALEPGQAELLARPYDAQWDQARPLLEEVRRCEAHLLQQGFSEDMEDLLAALIPTSPELLARQVGPPKRPETLEELFTQSASPEVRRLAALALLHQGSASPALAASARDSLFDASERIRLEAMLALSHWQVWQAIPQDEEGKRQLQELARKTLGHPELAPRAALAWVRASHGEPLETDVLAALSQGLRHGKEDVRFECAMYLLGSTQPGQAQEARTHLTVTGRWLFMVPAPGWKPLGPRPGPTPMVPGPVSSATLDALLSLSERGPHRLSEALLELIQSRPFASWPPECQARWSDWARAVFRELPGVPLLQVLAWVAVPPMPPHRVRTFVEGVAEAIDREPVAQRAASLRSKAFLSFLSLAGPTEEPLLNRWAREAECAGPLVEGIFDLISSIPPVGRPPQGKLARLLMAVWEGPGRQPLLEALAQKAHWARAPGAAELHDAVWQRFQQHPDERGELLFAFAAWRKALWERHQEVSQDAIANFEAWWRASPVELHDQAQRLMTRPPAAEVAQRARHVFAAADEVVTVRPLTATLAVHSAVLALSVAFKERAAELAPEVERFLEWFPRFEQQVRTTPVEQDRPPSGSGFLETILIYVGGMRAQLHALRQAEPQKKKRS